jgi:hypothetical protein
MCSFFNAYETLCQFQQPRHVMSSETSNHGQMTVAEPQDYSDASQTEFMQSIIITPLSPCSAAYFWYQDDDSTSVCSAFPRQQTENETWETPTNLATASNAPAINHRFSDVGNQNSATPSCGRKRPATTDSKERGSRAKQTLVNVYTRDSRKALAEKYASVS